MTVPTGHKTFTREENFKSRGDLFRNAREGDTYLDSTGKHWECRGTFVKPAPNDMVDAMAYGMRNWRQERGIPAMAYGMRNWRQERDIPAGVEIKYETSYTKTVVDGLLALGGISQYNTFPAMRAAVDLLKDYHKSLHAPYEQRDKARQDLVVAEAQLAAVQNELRLLRVRFRTRMRLLVNMSTRWKKDLEV